MLKPTLLFVPVAALATFFWWAYEARYRRYADCLDALTNSSCITPDGTNVTSGGIIWAFLALPFTVVAAVLLCVMAVRLVRRRSRDAA
ncbi:hypothetical protein [Luteimonas terrae]|uniref:Transmembrane protein n=1 Tax=Luteimonas terrae TaxID=1530191 RepID=A0ABU1Y0K3_9GAMM|nr:hypothetical protein [Luteimonas terrae]MDR7194559.1 hypothetical protein [Luteimonas terrae]